MTMELESLKSQYASKMDEWRLAFNTTNQLQHQSALLRRSIVKFTKTKIMDGKVFITYGDDKFELTKVGEDGGFPLYHIMKNKRMVTERYWGFSEEVKFDIVMGKL